MASRTICISLSVSGFLTGHDRDCRRLFKRKGTNAWMTPREAKEVLANYLAKGYEVLPIGQPCVGWDKRTGCPGHLIGVDHAPVVG